MRHQKLCFLLAFLLYSAPVSSMPRGSFISAPVETPQEFRRQVRAENLAPHYRKILRLTSDAEVERAFSELRLERIPSSRRVKMYFYRQGKGITGWKWRRVKKGRWWFVLSDGTPLIYRACGNVIIDPEMPPLFYKRQETPRLKIDPRLAQWAPKTILPVTPLHELDVPEISRAMEMPESYQREPMMQTVPESSSLLPFSAGLGTIAWRLRRRKGR